jgi:hypothetical protein
MCWFLLLPAPRPKPAWSPGGDSSKKLAGALAPTRNPVVEKKSLKFKELEHVLIDKVEQLF